MTARPSILIVGAGPTGLTAAIELWRRGYTPRIIDRDEAPTSLSKAVGVSPHSLDLLEPGGVTERLMAEGLRVRQIEARYRGRRLAAIDLSRIPHRFDFLLSLPQSHTERAMEAALQAYGGSVEWGTALTGLRVARDHVEVQLDGPSGVQSLNVNYVFGADGPHSRTREAAGIDFPGYEHERLWSIADAEIADWPYPPQTAEALLHPRGDIGFIIPIGPGRFRAVSNTPDAISKIPGIGGVNVLEADTFHLPVRLAGQYRRGGVFLGGDAAHVHSPVGARGMNLGIEDACCFARRMAEGALDGYEAERRPIGERWMKLSERLLNGVQTANPLTAQVRNLAIRTIGAFPSLQQPMMQRVAGLRE